MKQGRSRIRKRYVNEEEKKNKSIGKEHIAK